MTILPSDEHDHEMNDDAGEVSHHPDHRCGFAAIVGRPNVGKSTLLNALLKRKVSIVSPKPQTTRHRILGILTRPQHQIIFVDTPGIHITGRRMMNRYMNRSAQASLADADVIVFVIEALTWTDEDQHVLESIKATGHPLILLVNKVDKVHPKSRLLPFMSEVTGKAGFVEVVPIAGSKRINLDQLSALIAKHLPLSPPHFPEDQVTDRSDQFIAAEVIREKLTWRLRQELPYGLTVEIERYEFDEESGKLVINAVIWVERTGQKAIVIGDKGEGLKNVGRSARLELSKLLGKPVHLELWVKVKENWSDSEAALRQFGYDAS
ncbi:MAG TPA: GTPase Era [Steroidobacteraceae bacterium]|nr:GTPase Era [Steroidobacteraceae bacterium]